MPDDGAEPKNDGSYRKVRDLPHIRRQSRGVNLATSGKAEPYRTGQRP